MDLHSRLSFGLLCSLIGCFTAWPAYAYIDPGTASIALQAVIGAIAVIGIFFRHKVAQVLGLFRKSRDTQERDTKADPVPPTRDLVDR